MTVGDLKKIIKDIPDETTVVMADDMLKYHISRVMCAGILKCEYEEPDTALCFTLGGIRKEVPDFIEKVLYTDESLV